MEPCILKAEGVLVTYNYWINKGVFTSSLEAQFIKLKKEEDDPIQELINYIDSTDIHIDIDQYDSNKSSVKN